MIRAVSIAIAAEALLLGLCQTSLAASDITIAAIATGRLYVVGTTERPHQPVVEAVVGNCGQQEPPASTASSPSMKGASSVGLATRGPSGPPGPQGPAGSPGLTGTPDPATTAVPGASLSASPVASTPMATKSLGETTRVIAKPTPIAQSFAPPQHPILATAPPAKPVRSPPSVGKPKPKAKPQSQPEALAPNDN